MKIGLQFAMPVEFHALPGAKDIEPFQTISGVPFYHVAPDVIACAGGIGKVNAAIACEILCLSFKVDMVVNAGVAGCMTDLPTGSIVVPSDYVQHDMDTSAIGDAPGFVSTVNRLEFPTWRPERCLSILRGMGVDAFTGRAATGDWFATGTERAKWIRDTFNPVLMEMVGCAIAQACCRNDTPFVALKSVSDHLFKEGQVEEYFDFGQALENLGKILLPFTLALQKETLA